MILQSLHEYYQRKQAHDATALAPEGFEFKEIPFVVVLNPDGTVFDLRDTRQGTGKQRRAKRFTVPKAAQRTVGIAASLLWDNAEYTLGLACEGRTTSSEALTKRLNAFRERLHAELGDCDDPGVKAVEAFLAKPEPAATLTTSPAFAQVFAEIKASNPNLTFQLIGDGGTPVAMRQAVIDRLRANQALRAEAAAASADDLIRCLVSGERGELARLHTPIKGVWGAQSSGAGLVSFNLPAFTSFGKEQGANAPVSRPVAEGYTTALNALLGKDSKLRAQIGDASTVFWASKPSVAVLSVFAAFLVKANPALATKDDPDANAEDVKRLYASIHNGQYIGADGNETFYVLGLSPNAARLSVRFWYAAPIREFSRQVHRYFEDIRIDMPAYDGRTHLPLPVLLQSIAVQGKVENIPPNIAGDTLRAVLSGQPFPAALLNLAVVRCRAESAKGAVTPARASLLKACLMRQDRTRNPQETPLTMSLNLDNKNPAYRLGRLFATLERIQADALGGVNASIRDRYYGAASASPASVFGLLLKNANHHLSKMAKDQKKAGLARFHEKLLGEIIDGLGDDMPVQMPFGEQARFAVGYYHQVQAFYARKDKGAVPPDSAEPSPVPDDTTISA